MSEMQEDGHNPLVRVMPSGAGQASRETTTDACPRGCVDCPCKKRPITKTRPSKAPSQDTRHD